MTEIPEARVEAAARATDPLRFMDALDAGQMGQRWLDEKAVALPRHPTNEITDLKLGNDGRATILWERRVPVAAYFLVRDVMNFTQLLRWTAAADAAVPTQVDALRAREIATEVRGRVLLKPGTDDVYRCSFFKAELDDLLAILERPALASSARQDAAAWPDGRHHVYDPILDKTQAFIVRGGKAELAPIQWGNAPPPSSQPIRATPTTDRAGEERIVERCARVAQKEMDEHGIGGRALAGVIAAIRALAPSGSKATTSEGGGR